MADRENRIRIVIDANQAKTEVDQLNQKLGAIDRSAKIAGAGATAGFSGLERGAQLAGGSTKALKAQVEASREAFALQKREVAESRLALASLNQQLADLVVKGRGGSAAADALRTSMTQTRAALQGMTAEQGVAAIELRNLEEALDKTSSAWDKKTTRINVGRGALAGYDAAIEGTVRAFGGLNLGFAVAIGLLSNLAPKIFELASGTRELVALNAEAIGVNNAMAQSFSAISSRGIIAAQNIALLGESAENVKNAGLAVTLDTTATKMLAVEKGSAELAKAFATATNPAARDLGLEMSRYANATAEAAVSQEVARAKIPGMVEELEKNKKSLAENVEGLRLLRDNFGFTEQRMVSLLRQFGAGEDKAQALLRAINADIAGLQAFSKELANAETRMFNAAHAAAVLTVELKAIRAPKIDVEGLRGVEGAIATLKGGIATLEQAGRGKTLKDLTVGLAPEIENVTRQMQKMAAASASSKEEARRLFTEMKSGADLQVRGLMDSLERTNSNMDAFSKKAGGGAGAARRMAAEAKSLAQVMNDLAKEIKDANAALLGDSFATREARIRAEIEEKRNALKINKQLTVENAAALDELERLRLAKLGADRLDVERDFQRQVDRIGIEASNNKIERLRKEAQLEIGDFARAVRERIGESERADKLIADFRLTKTAETERKVAEIEEKARQDRLARESRFEDLIQGERLKKAKDALENMEKVLKGAAAARGRVISQTRPGPLGPANDNQIDSIIKGVQRLGGEFKDAATDARLIDRALDEVHKDFGFVSRDSRVLERQLRSLAKVADGDFAGGLKDQLIALSQEFVLSGGVAQAWSDAIVGAFDLALNSGANFVAAFGKLLLAGMLKTYGEMAVIAGQVHIAKGIARMAGFDFAGGARELAAGTALVALGAAMGAAASALQRSAQQGGSGQGGLSASQRREQQEGVNSRGSATPPGAEGTFTGPRSRFSPGPEVQGGERIEALNRQILAVQGFLDRTTFGPIKRFLQRELELLEAERRALGAIGVAARQDLQKTLRLAIDATGQKPQLPPINVEFDAKDTARMAVTMLSANGVVTTESIDGRHRAVVKRKTKKMN